MVFDDISSIGGNGGRDAVGIALLPEGNSGSTVSGRPVLHFTLILNQWLGGVQLLAGYHFVNLLIHFGGTLALFGLARATLLLPSMRRYCKVIQSSIIAFLIAALWSLHPLQTESVTYIIQRAESLAGFFYILTLYCFIRATKGDAAHARILWFVLSVVACLLGMASKETVASAPLIILLYDRTFVSGSFSVAWRNRRLYYGALAATWLVLAFCIIWSGSRGGTVGAFDENYRWHYLLTQSQAIIHYIWLSFFPYPLVFDYGYACVRSLGDVIFQAIGIVLLLGLTIWALWKKPIWGFLGAFFFLILAPTSSVVPIVTQTMAEHRMYLALMPIVAIVVCAIFVWSSRFASLICAALLVVLSVMTFSRNKDYYNGLTLWQTSADACPENARAWSSLGGYQMKTGQLEAAKASFAKALEIEPWRTNARIFYAELLFRTGNLHESCNQFEKVVDTISKDEAPLAYYAYNNYSLVLAACGLDEQAIAWLQKAVALMPEKAGAYYNIGKILDRNGHWDDAISAYQRAVCYDPAWVNARNNLGELLTRLGQFPEAIDVLKPGLNSMQKLPELHYNIAIAYWKINKNEEAAEQFAEALVLNPNFKEAHINLGILLAAQGRLADACTHYEAALKLTKGRNALLSAALGQSLFGLGRRDEAISKLREAADIASDDLQISYILADMLGQAGYYNEALERLKQITMRMPQVSLFQISLGRVYEKLGQRAAALQCYEVALRLEPGNAEAEKLRDAISQEK